MDDLKQDISARLKEARLHLKMSVSEFARALGVEAQTIRDYENGKSILGGDKVAKMIQLGVDSNWLLAGPGYDSIPFNEYLTVAEKYQSIARSDKSVSDSEKLYDPEKVYVKRYVDVKGSAGPGYNNDTDGLIELVEFNAGALRNIINVPAQHLVIGGVDGYSMEPFLFHGDQVFIDTRHQTFQNDGVYALLHNGELRYKRVRINYADKTVLLKSDNDGGLGPEVLNEDQANGLRIIGKVIPFKFGHFKL